MTACDTNNLLHKYLIRKFVDINIYEFDEYPFRWSCANGYSHIAKWLIDLGKKSNLLVDIHRVMNMRLYQSCAMGICILHNG